jgi:glucose/arabinose dehydrogenase
MPLIIPDGFNIETFATGVPGARVIVQDGMGNFWVSRTSAGIVSQLEMGDDGKVKAVHDVFRGLNNPHGLAVDPERGMTLYIAEENKISRAYLYSDGPIETVAALPAAGRHYTRTLGFGPDGKLYVSIGSTCDVCVEKDPEIAAIISMNADGSDRQIVARGLRNSVFFDWNYVTGDLYATDMGRDQLGDDLPPEEVNIIRQGNHYGWPFCYGDRVRDISFQRSTEFDCSETVAPHLTMPAHIAPLGLTFIPEEGWPEEYWYDLLVAQHGSWNSTSKVGYKVVRLPLDAQGNSEGPAVDFVSGWLSGNTVYGRPVDVMAVPGGTLYITDDKAGVVYGVRINESPR